MEFRIVLHSNDNFSTPSRLSSISDLGRLFGNTNEQGQTSFVWIDDGGKVTIPTAVAPKPGWRLATDEDVAMITIPAKVEVVFNQ